MDRVVLLRSGNDKLGILIVLVMFITAFVSSMEVFIATLNPPLYSSECEVLCNTFIQQ